MDESIRSVLRAWAESKPQIFRLWLIGSRARGTHRPDSDYDLVVAFDPSLEAGMLLSHASDYCEPWQSELVSTILRSPVDLLAYEVGIEDTDLLNFGWNLKEVVAAEGILLFERSSMA